MKKTSKSEWEFGMKFMCLCFLGDTKQEKWMWGMLTVLLAHCGIHKASAFLLTAALMKLYWS